MQQTALLPWNVIKCGSDRGSLGSLLGHTFGATVAHFPPQAFGKVRCADKNGTATLSAGATLNQRTTLFACQTIFLQIYTVTHVWNMLMRRLFTLTPQSG